MAAVRAVFKFMQFFFWCAVLIPPQACILLFTRGRGAYILPQFWHIMVCRAFGIRVEVTGCPIRDRQVLYVGNHLSYLDISAISSVLPVSFVAKDDVARWPLFGLLARLQRTAFISRDRGRAASESDALRARLFQGGSLAVFPEGTSSDGTAVLPFKSSLFELVCGEGAVPVTVQPFTISLAEIDGRVPAGQAERDIYAWYGAMTLAPHFLAFAKCSGVKVRLHFHPPVAIQQGVDRKALARRCRDIVAGAAAAEAAVFA